MSPCIVMFVFGCLSYILFIACCKLFMNSGSGRGLLKILIIVCMGFFLCSLSCICRIIVAALFILMSSMNVVYRSCLL